MNINTTDASTQIFKELSYKMHIATLKNLYYQKYFEGGHLIAASGSPFSIYWVCRLFDECKPNKNMLQKEILKKLISKYLFWGRLSQINDVPYHCSHCFQCRILDDPVQILLDRNQLAKEPEPEFGLTFDASKIYFNFCNRKIEIAKEYGF